MPESCFPTTPEQWAAVEPNETDSAVVYKAEVDGIVDRNGFAAGQSEVRAQIADVSRLLERERCVERLAQEIVRRGDTLQPGHQPTNAEAAAEARRILEDAK